MSFELAVNIAFLLIVGSVVYLSIRLQRARMARQEDELRRAASARGWSFEASHRNRAYVHRWQGMTDFVQWTAEFVQLPRGKNQRGRSTRSRWWADTLRGPARPILLMGVPVGKEAPSFAIAQGEGLFASLAQRAAGYMYDKSIDNYFGIEVGQQVDARELKPVEGAALPGFIVMAGDPSEASRLLFAGLKKQVDAATHDPQCALADDDHRPWVLLQSRRVDLARIAPMATAADVERMVRAGLHLVKGPSQG